MIRFLCSELLGLDPQYPSIHINGVDLGPAAGHHFDRGEISFPLIAPLDTT
jgi:hypothetical protein